MNRRHRVAEHLFENSQVESVANSDLPVCCPPLKRKQPSITSGNPTKIHEDNFERLHLVILHYHAVAPDDSFESSPQITSIQLLHLTQNSA